MITHSLPPEHFSLTLSPQFKDWITSLSLDELLRFAYEVAFHLSIGSDAPFYSLHIRVDFSDEINTFPTSLKYALCRYLWDRIESVHTHMFMNHLID